MLRDEAGGVFLNSELKSRVMACAIESEWSRDDLLEGIQHVHKLCEKTFAGSVFPGDSDQVPALLRGYVESTEQFRVTGVLRS